jgi:hypothetical protein
MLWREKEDILLVFYAYEFVELVTDQTKSSKR